MTIWCIAHISDLPFEAMSNAISEVKHWKADLKSVANYYRGSARRMQSLKNLNPDALNFPRHHEVRFAEHLINLVKALVTNQPAMMQHWESISTSTDKKKQKTNAL